MIVFAVAMLALSGWKSYRFCIKYTCRDYLRRKRMQRYLAAEARQDSEETEFKRR